MNWTQLLQMFEPTRDGWPSAASCRVVDALKLLFAAQSNSRRPKAEACGQAERLEVRQVLSVANPAAVMNAAVSEPEPQASGFDVPTPEPITAVRTVGEADPVAVEQDSSESLQNDRAESDSIWNLAGLSEADRSSFLAVNTSGNLLKSSVAAPTTPLKIAVNTSTPNDPLTSVIDEAFHDSGAILDSLLPSSVIDESVASASTVQSVPEGLTPSPNNPIPLLAVPGVQNTARNLQVTVPELAIPAAPNAAPVSIIATLPPACSWDLGTSSTSEFAARPQQTAAVTSRQSLSDSGQVPQSVGRRSIVSNDGAANHGWLAGLSELNWFATDYEPSPSPISTSPIGADTLPVAVPLADYSVAPQRSPQNLTVTAQTKARQLREGQRLNSASARLADVDEIDDSSLDLIDTEDVPRALKYVVLPRGPPRRQPHTVLRIMDSDAGAIVLQRLRYSIAPRGPSTVTVEMQSPEERSFSGPRVSPQESLSMRLVC